MLPSSSGCFTPTTVRSVGTSVTSYQSILRHIAFGNTAVSTCRLALTGIFSSILPSLSRTSLWASSVHPFKYLGTSLAPRNKCLKPLTPNSLQPINCLQNSKPIPLQPWTDPEGSRLPDSRQSTHEGGKVVSPKHRPPLPPRKYSRY